MPRSTPYWRIFHITNTLSSVSTSQSRQKVLIVTSRMDPTYVPTLAQGSTLKESHFLATSRLRGRMSSTKIRCCVLCCCNADTAVQESVKSGPILDHRENISGGPARPYSA